MYTLYHSVYIIPQSRFVGPAPAAEVSDVFCDMLCDVFEQHTGLHTSL